MTDHPSRPALDPVDGGSGAGQPGWGSPVPSEYGPLRALRASGTEVQQPEVARPEVRDRDAGAGRKSERQHQAVKPTLSNRVRNRGDGRNGSSRVAPEAEGAPLDPGPWTGRPEAGSDSYAPTMEVHDRHDVTRRGEAIGAGPRPGSEPTGPLVRSAVSRRARRRPVGRVRSRVTVRHVDVLTVVRVSLVFYFLVAVVVVVASVLLWYAADAFGSITSIEKSIRTLFDLKTFTLHPETVAIYTSAAGLVLALAGTLANVLAALTYNLICDVVGGVRIEVESPLGTGSVED